VRGVQLIITAGNKLLSRIFKSKQQQIINSSHLCVRGRAHRRGVHHVTCDQLSNIYVQCTWSQLGNAHEIFKHPMLDSLYATLTSVNETLNPHTHQTTPFNLRGSLSPLFYGPHIKSGFIYGLLVASLLLLIG
jgi:hypothetical protein